MTETCPQPARWHALGVPVDAVDPGGAAALVGRMLDCGVGGWVATPNPEIVCAAWRDPDLARAICAASLSVADGVGLVWASRILGGPVRAQVPGIDLLDEALERCAARGWPVYLLGGGPGVAGAAALEASRRWPGLKVAGHHHGYFDQAGEARLLEEIHRAAPRLIAAGMGHPKQELWLAANIPLLPATVGIACGGSLDVLAGVTRRAPSWARRANLEWLYRLLSGPRRRWRRSLALPVFVARVLALRLGLSR
jgi:N-acetylglucosaminyldiphosphoundecaprenol N-acetyl-beta-D-mannosaminyltransferase